MREIMNENGYLYPRAHIRDTPGPIRVITFSEEDPQFVSNPIGFTAQFGPVEIEPDVWDGDNA